MKKALFVCSEWFKKTTSQKFFIKFLKEHYKVKVLYGLDWKNGFNVKSNKNFDTYFFWQILPPQRQLKEIAGKKIVWVPLYDGKKGWLSVILRKMFLLKFNIKALCFSQKLFSIIRFFFPAYYVQYFPKPQNRKINFKNIRIFFWQRINEINIHTMKKLFDISKIDNITVKIGLDQANTKTEFETNAKIKILDKWTKKSEYLKMLNKFNIYVAPRVTEGIGLSFLEPMANGTIIIAHNDATMNEYIKNAKTGFIFNYNKPKRINLENLEIVSQNTKEFMKNGYLSWIKKKPNIVHWIEEE